MLKVLIVDDYELGQETIADWLNKDFEVEILFASNVSEAKVCLKENLIDFIICDYEMPGGNGDEFLEYIRDNILNIPFILFSGRGDLKIPLDPPVVDVIDDKNYNKLFKKISQQRLFLLNQK